MARPEIPNHQMAVHYTNMVCALAETRKGSNCDPCATEAIDNTIKGMCGLIDAFVTQEHKGMSKTGGTQ